MIVKLRESSFPALLPGRRVQQLRGERDQLRGGRSPEQSRPHEQSLPQDDQMCLPEIRTFRSTDLDISLPNVDVEM